MSIQSVASRIGATISMAALAVSLAAQAPAPKDTAQRQPPIRARANYVRVDVYPTKDGQPVMDLRAEDFELSESGTPQEISTFEHVVISLMKLQEYDGIQEPIPGIEPIGVGPGGKITTRNKLESLTGASKYDCDIDRMRLANEDNEHYVRQLADAANRGNTTFYPIDPRGLAVWDAPIGPEKPPPPAVDQANLRRRLEAIRNLASATDGIALTTSNNLDVGLRRIADDLTSYYLIGYYSTNTKLDGTFRRIGVRVKRPGVHVRARRGYRAATEEEVLAARAAAPPEPVSVETAAADAAIDALTRIRPEARFRIHASPFGDAANGSVSLIWIAGELQAPRAEDPWKRGGTGDIDVTAGGATTTAHVTIAPGERTFLTAIALPSPISGGAIDVRARLTGTDPEAARLADSIHVPLTSGARLPLLFRRGPTTGNRVLPSATFLFSRTERVRVDIPVAASVRPGTGRLIERGGKTSPVPVTVGARTDDGTGQHWITADVTLAPLGAGDYTNEVSILPPGAATEHRVFTALRVVR